MSGTAEGGAKAAATTLARHGDDFYSRIGKKGGLTPKKRPGGFATNRELASIVGRRGGAISKRGPSRV